MDRLQEVDLLLLGKTGNGKSATGNSILKRRAFLSKASVSSVTMNIAYEVSEYNGRLIKVVDGPGVGDTGMDNHEGIELVKKAMENAIAVNDRGYHAFLLVVRFSVRFTKEDKEAIDLLKSIFGASFVKNYCILIMTHGDCFEKQREDMGQTFEEWCEEQKGFFKTLYLECDKRIILFDNTASDEREINKQLDKLLNTVDSLRYQGHRYCDEHFERAKATRERADVEAKEPQIREEAMTETSLILQKLQQIQKMQRPEDQLVQLTNLQGRSDALYKRVKEEDKGTGALHKLFETVDSIKRTVQNQTEVCDKMIVYAEQCRKEEQKWEEEKKKLEKMIEDRNKEQREDEKKQQNALKMMETKIKQQQEEHLRLRKQEVEQRNQMEKQNQKLQEQYEELRKLSTRVNEPIIILPCSIF